MATQIGVIKAVLGTVTATAMDGSTRTLQIGDQVYANELISTGQAGAVEIEFADGSVMDLGRNSQAMLDNGVFDPEATSVADAPSEDIPDDVAAIQQALLDGEDPIEAGEATAAGAGVAGSGNEGHEAVFVDYLNPEVTPDAGFDTIGVNNTIEEVEDEQLLDGVPTAGVTTVTLDEDDLVEGGSVDLGSAGGEFLSFLNGQGVSGYSFDSPNGVGDERPEVGDDPADGYFLSGSLVAAYGLDGPNEDDPISFNAVTGSDVTDSNGNPVTSEGQQVKYWVSADGLTVIGYIAGESDNPQQPSPQVKSLQVAAFDGCEGPGDDYPALAEIIFTAQLTPTEEGGSFLVGIFGQFDHAEPDYANGEFVFEDNLLLNLGFTITDADGDSTTGTLQLDVDDDSPVRAGEGEQLATQTATVVEDGLSFEDGDLSEGNPNAAVAMTVTSGGSSADQSDIESFLGLAPGALEPAADSNGGDGIATNGSASKTTLAAEAGDIISFSWSFDNNDGGPWNDFAFVVINGEVFELADSNGGDLVSNPFTYEVTADGVITVGFGQMNVGDTGVDSSLTVSDLTLNGSPVNGGFDSSLTGWDTLGSVSDSDSLVASDVASGNLNSVVNMGADGPGSFALLQASENEAEQALFQAAMDSLPTLSSKGEAVTYSINEYGELVATAGEGEDAREVFTLTVDSDGQWTFDLNDQLDHVGGDTAEENFSLITLDENGEPNGSVDSLDFTQLLQIRDFDGDQLIITEDDAGMFTISIKDDIPVATDETVSVTVDEDDIRTNLSSGNDAYDNDDDGSYTGEPITIYGYTTDFFNILNGGGPATTTGSVATLVSFGADETGTFSLGSDFAALEAQGLTSKGDELSFEVNGDTLVASADGRAVFTLELEDNGDFSFSLYDQLDHAAGNGENNLPLDLSSVIQATDSDNDTITLDSGFVIDVTDDIPVQAGHSPDIGIVEEEALPAGNQEENDGSFFGYPIDGWPDTAVATGSLQDQVSVGADDSVTFGFASDLSALPDLTSNGLPVNYNVDGDTLTASTDSGDVFTLTLESNGDYTFTLIGALDHAPVQGENLEVINFSSIVEATDFDGDTITLDNDFYIKIVDDMPVATDETVSVTVDEDDIRTNLSSGNDAYDNDDDGSYTGEPVTIFGYTTDFFNILNGGGPATTTGSVAPLVSFGADENGTFSLGDNFAGLDGQGLTSKGDELSYEVNGDTLVASADGRAVFTLELDDNGDFTFSLYDQLDHAAGNGENNLPLDLSSVIQATDSDNDTITLDSGFTIDVTDDVPEYAGAADYGIVEEEALPAGNKEENDGSFFGYPVDGWPDTAVATGSLQDQVSVGADEGASFSLSGDYTSLIAQNLTSDGEPVTYQLVDNTLTASAGQTPVFSLTLESNGHYTFTLMGALDHSESHVEENLLVIDLSGVVIAEDFDGDTLTLSNDFYIKVVDDSPEVGNNAVVVLDDDALEGGNPGGPGDNADAANVTGTLSHSFGADGGSISWQTNGAPSGFSYEADGDDLLVKQNGETVLTLTLNPETGEYSVTQNAPIEHRDNGNNIENNQRFDINYQVTDTDGDTAQGAIRVNVDDDTPTVAEYEVNTMRIISDDDTVAGLNGNPGEGANTNDGAGTDSKEYNQVKTLQFSVGADGGTVAWNTDTSSVEDATAGITFAVDGDGSLLIMQDQGGVEPVQVATVTLDENTGDYVYTQTANVLHTPGNDENEASFKLGFTVTDGDGDSADGYVTLLIDDDTPTVADYEVNTMRIISDDDTVAGLNGNPGEGANTNDGAGTDSKEYNQTKTLQFSTGADGGTVAWNADNSSVDDGTAGISFSVNGDGSLVLTQEQDGVPVEIAVITLDENTGDYTYTQTGNVLHTAGDAENEAAFTLGFTVTDGDGDTADGHLTLLIDDDTPVITSQQLNLLSESFENFAPDLSGNNWTIVGEGGGTIIGNNGIEWTVNGAGIEIQSGNVGGASASDGDVHAELDAHDSNGDGGSTLTTLSTEVNLPTTEATLSFDFQPRPDDVDGSDMAVSLGGQIVNINVDGAGVIDFGSLPNGVSASQSSSAGGWTTITLTFTGLDTSSAQTLIFEGVGSENTLGAYIDDINLNAVSSLTVDESALADGSGEAGASTTASFDFSGFFTGAFGADGEGSESYNLNLNGSDVASGLFTVDNADTDAGDGDGYGQGTEIVLNQVGGDIVGSAGGVNYFTISVNTDTGEVTLTQLDNIWHTDTNNADDSQGMVLDADLLSLVKTITDADDDSAEAVLDLGGVNFNFEDDGPVAISDVDSIVDGSAAGNVVTAESTDGEAGVDNFGADGAGSVTSVTFGGTTVDVPAQGAAEIDGDYGTLSLSADGSYTYTANPDSLPQNTETVEGWTNSGSNMTAFNLGESFLNADGTFSDTGTGAVTTGGNTQGFGVAGTTGANTSVPEQVNQSGSESEALAFKFTGDVTSATVQLSNLFQNENGGEAMRWHAFDAEGNRIDSGIVSDNDASDPYAGDTTANYTSNNEGSFTISDIGAFSTLVFEGVPYSNDGSDGSDDSDFFVNITSYDVFDTQANDYQDEFTYTIVDGDGDSAEATLTLNGESEPQEGQLEAIAPVAADNTYQIDGVTTGNIITDDDDNGGAETGRDYDNDTPVINLSINSVIFDGDVTFITEDNTEIELDNGTLVINLDGSYNYTPAQDADGGDEFEYTLIDPDGEISEPATVTLLETQIVDVLTLDDVSVNEGDGTATITGSVENPVTGTPLVITLDNGATITIPVGDSSAVSTPFPVQGDDPYIDAENYTVEVTGTTGGNYSSLDISDDATVNISDTIDTTTVTLDDVSVAEDGTITYSASVDNAPEGDLNITLNNGVVITIANGLTTGSSAPQAAQGDDVYIDADSDTVSITSTSGGNYEQLDTTDTATVTISDTIDTVTATLTTSTTEVSEDGGDIIYTVTLTGGPGVVDPDADLVIDLANGEQVTILAGQTSGSVTATYTDADITNQTTITNSISGVVSGGTEYENLQTAGSTSVDVDYGPVIEDLTPQAQGGDVSVDEDDLTDGSDTSKESTTQEGTFTISAADGIDDLTIGGEAVITDGVFSATSFTTGLGNTLSVTGFDAGTGEITYSYELTDNTLTHGPADNGENNVFENFAVVLSDTDGDLANDVLSVQIVDDVPTPPADITKTVSEGSGAATNLMVILDVSGSMDDNPGVSGFDTRLAVAKEAVNDLIDAYDDMGDVMVRFVTFNSNGAEVGPIWMTATQASDWIDALSDYAGNSLTDYDAALAAAQNAFADSGKIVGAQNVSYFLSDGEPTDGNGSDGITSSEELAWENFLVANDITSYALGMGSGVNQSNLEPIAYDGANAEELSAIVVTDFSQLSTVLSENVITPETGNIVTEGNITGSFGADGIAAGGLQIVSFSHDADGNDATPSVVYDANASEYDASTNVLTINTYAGGTLSVNFETGAYSYTAPDGVSEDINDVFTYTIQDADGDQATGNFVITVEDGVPVAQDDSNSVDEAFWNINGTESASVTVEGWSDTAQTENVSVNDSIDPSEEYFLPFPPFIFGGPDSNNTNEFEITADSAHEASVSVDVDVRGYNSSDVIQVSLFKDGQSGAVETVTVSGNNNFSQTVNFSGLTESGDYYIRLYGDDNSGSRNLRASLSELKVTAFDFGQNTYSTTVNTAALSALAAATGNVLANDDAGTDGGLSVTEVNGNAVSGSTDIDGLFGTLTIDENGDYSYTPNAEDLPAGSSESFTYTVTDADGSEDTATLSIDINDHNYVVDDNDNVAVADAAGGSVDAQDGNDVLIGSDQADTLNGGAGDDNLMGNDGDDTLIGGAGNDILTGGEGADIFQWNAGDEGTAGSPAVDFITDFDTAEGDVLDLADLLVGENDDANDLTEYLSFESDGTDTVVNVSTTSGGDATQQIVLQGVDLTQGGTVSDQDIIQTLLGGNNLNVDPS